MGGSSSLSQLRRNDSDSLLFKADDLLHDNDEVPALDAFESLSSPILALAASRNPELNEIEQFLMHLDQLPPLQTQPQPLVRISFFSFQGFLSRSPSPLSRQLCFKSLMKQMQNGALHKPQASSAM